jgi:hypothetical protein
LDLSEVNPDSGELRQSLCQDPRIVMVFP